MSTAAAVEAATHAASRVADLGAASQPLSAPQWRLLTQDVLRDAGGSLPSVRKVRKEGGGQQNETHQ